MAARASARIASKPKLTSMDLLTAGYSMFSAKQGGKNDGSQSCNAKFYVGSGTAATKYYGQTGEGTHAEMNAIHQYLVSIKFSVDVFNANTYRVKCEAKPCCVKCSAVLGLLGVEPYKETWKSPDSMGSTQWSLPPAFRAFLSEFLGCTTASVDALCGNVAL